SSGRVIRIEAKEIPTQGRATKGVRIISILPGEYVSRITVLENSKI
ncbi:hypothetical protein DRN73_02220, partial [Candidatus Pacearchaeota archaeon]